MEILKTIGNLIKREIGYYFGKPDFATFELTYRCNLTCKTCGVWKEKNVKEHIKNEIPLNIIERILRDLKMMGVKRISLLGGETLIRKDIIEIFELIKQFGFFLVFTTNATMITGEIADEIVRYVDVINYSLDAFGEDHDRIRGIPGTFKRAKRGIELVRDAKRAKNSLTPRAYITTVLSKLNYNVFDKLASLSEDVESLAFGYLSETSRDSVDKSVFDGKVIATEYFLPNEGESLLPNDEEIAVIRKKINELEAGQYRNSVFAGGIKALSHETMKYGRYPVKKCYSTRSRVIINPVGDVIPCANLRELSYGNVKEQSIKDIWNGDIRKRFVAQLSGKLFPVCPSCCHFSLNPTFVQSVQRIIISKYGKA